MVFTMGLKAQTITIDAARTLGAGATVTVKGLVTNGDEIGGIRYFQDGTAGIAAYSTTLSTVTRGDSILITGTIKDYNQLLEIDPVTSFTVINSGNLSPIPQIVTPNGLDETNEGELVQIDNATFTTSPGGLFSSNSPYSFTANGETSTIYVRSNHPLIGTIIPSGPVTLVGITSQYSYTDPNGGYQLLCRDTNDIILSNNISMTSTIMESNISTTGITLSWSTNLAGSSEIMYGNTTALGSSATGTAATTSHSVSLTSLSASEIIYVKAFSVDGTDTAFSPVKTFITQSNSTGDMIAYFNTAVDNTVSSGTDAIYLPNAIDDTLIAYINRATESIDFTMYNFNEDGISSISSALNAAYTRGVTVRVIFDGSATNSGIQNLLSDIKKVASPTGSEYGIMHNKFIIFDANSTDANTPLVWTGGTNMTDGQVNTDPNTVIIVQDKSLALAFTLEFNEMFGSTTAIPDMTNIKFGIYKTDNTPHNFIIGGKDVQCFFSPSDGTNSQILKTIDNADENMSIATMLITRSDIAYALDDAVNNRNVDLQILVNSEGQCSATVWTLLSALLGNDLQEDAAVTGIMHHKFMVVDEGTSSNPTLLVGSHNWSNAANNTNDENTLIFHNDQTIANIYYQAFKKRFDENKTASIMENGFAKSAIVYPNPNNGEFTIEIDATQSMDLEINIHDLSGRKVWNSRDNATIGKNQINVKSKGLAAGTYLIQVISNEKTFVSTIIIN